MLSEFLNFLRRDKLGILGMNFLRNIADKMISFREFAIGFYLVIEAFCENGSSLCSGSWISAVSHILFFKIN